MDQDSQPDAAFYASIFQAECCFVAVTGFVVYDLLATLPREVQLFWTGKTRRSLPAILYFSNKYLNVLSAITCMFLYLPQSDKSCTTVDTLASVVIYLSVLPPAGENWVVPYTRMDYTEVDVPVFAGLRAYALTRRHWLAALIFLLSSAQFLTDMVSLGRFPRSDIDIMPWGCLETTAPPPSVNQIILIMNRVSVLVADITLVAITWKLWPDSRVITSISRGGNGRRKGFASIMVFNGITYFIALSILNILHLIFTKLSVATDGETSLMTAFTAPLSSVFVSHFLLDLQECYQKTVIGLATSDLPHSSRSFDVSDGSVHFAPALGSLGAVLGTPDDNHLEEDEVGVED